MALLPTPAASISRFIREPSPVIASAGVSETSNMPCSSIDCVKVGAVFALAKILPGATDLIFMTCGSKRKAITARPSGGSELTCTEICRASPNCNSLFSGRKLNSITPAAGGPGFASAPVGSVFGVSCSTAGAIFTSDLALADVLETSVDGETTLFIAVATSIDFGGAVSVRAAVVFGSGMVEPAVSALAPVSIAGLVDAAEV